MKILKSKHKKRWLFLVIIATSVIIISSCGVNDVKNRFDYALHNFDAEISGTIDGDKISARLQSRPNAGGEDPKAVLFFDSPDSLGGLVLSTRADGTSEARLGELILRGFNTDGFWEPFLTLLYSGEIASITRTEDGSTIVSVKDKKYDLEYLFQKGYEYPYSIKGTVGEREIELFVQSLDFVS